MKRLNLSFVRRVALTMAVVPLMVGVAHAEKSMWQKFKDFFTPGETIECEGPICDELHELESRISKVEGKYSRERRPVHKERYKKELDSLNVIRDSLVAVVKGVQTAQTIPTSSAAALPASSAVLPSSSAAVQSVAPELSPAAAAQPASNTQVLSATEVAALVCKPDTVYVRDTVVVHDTLYVVVTNKSETNP